MTYSIYTITNDQTGRVYVGMTTVPQRRFQDHLRYLRLGKHANPGLLADYRQGHSFSYSVILTDIEDRWTAKAAESDLIAATANAYNCQRSTTTKDTVRAALALLAAGFSHGKISKLLNINQATVHRIRHGKCQFQLA